MSNVSLNVISSKKSKELLTDITEMVADVLAKTFGPYGQHALIQSTSTVYGTKDGWNVMQMIRVTDKNGENSVVGNALKKLIQDVAQSVLLNAGDGTTTATIGAAKLNALVSSYLKTRTIDTRTIEETLRTCCKMIEKHLYTNAVMVTDDNMEDIIYRIALISTNWDTEVSGLIRDIYCKTKNPIIKVEDSGNLNTYAEYIEGYDLVGHLELPNYYLTSPARGLFEATDPLILTFGSAVHKSMVRTLSLVGDMLEQNGRRLVIVAPSYDLDFLNALKAYNGSRMQNKLRPANIVPFKYFAKTEIDKDCVDDFATLTGGILLTNEYEEVETVFERLAELIEKNNPQKKETETSKKKQEQIVTECIEVLERFGGTCNKLVANDKYILASGLSNKDVKEFKRRKQNLENELEMKYKQSSAESTLTDMIRVKRLRLGKMQCSMGVIKIGGFGASHLKEKKDAIDDATRACEIAYQDGYIMDGGMAIPIAAKCAITELGRELIGKPNATEKNNLLLDMLCLFKDAFCEVATILINNKYDDLEKSQSIVKRCVDTNRCYNLINDDFTDDLITPVAACKEVLNGCLRLVLINATSNQFVFLNEDDLILAIKSAPELETDSESDDEE